MNNNNEELNPGKKVTRERAVMVKIGIVCSVLLMADIIWFWIDNLTTAFWFNLMFCYVPIFSFFLFIIAFIKSCRFETVWHKVMFVCGIATFLLFIACSLIPNPKSSCNPDIMAKHYEEHKAEMRELCDYMQSVLDDSTAIQLEFEGNKQGIFRVKSADSDSFSWGVDSDSKRDSLMQVVGLTEEEYVNIRKKLKTMGCIGVEASRLHPESTEIWFRQIGMGGYDFVLYNRPMTKEEKENALNSYTLIPYDDSTLFQYGGGAIGKQEFTTEEREAFLKKHPY